MSICIPLVCRGVAIIAASVSWRLCQLILKHADCAEHVQLFLNLWYFFGIFVSKNVLYLEFLLVSNSFLFHLHLYFELEIYLHLLNQFICFISLYLISLIKISFSFWYSYFSSIFSFFRMQNGIIVCFMKRACCIFCSSAFSNISFRQIFKVHWVW